jgi:hypothetical protein
LLVLTEVSRPRRVGKAEAMVCKLDCEGGNEGEDGDNREVFEVPGDWEGEGSRLRVRVPGTDAVIDAQGMGLSMEYLTRLEFRSNQLPRSAQESWWCSSG